MDFLNSILKKEKTFSAVCSDIESGKLPIFASGLSQIHKSLIVSAYCSLYKKKAVIITHDEASASEVYGDLKALGTDAVMLPVRDYELQRVLGGSKEYEYKRINTLSLLAYGDFGVLVMSADSAVCYTSDIQAVKNSKISLACGAELKTSEFFHLLDDCGYKRSELCEGEGQYSVRGGIIDIFPVNLKKPVRIELWGDEIDTMSEFDPIDQRRIDPVDGFDIFPAKELIFDKAQLAKNISLFIEKNEKDISEKQKRYMRRDIETLENGGDISADIYIPLIYSKKCSVFDYIKDIPIFVFESQNCFSRLKSLSKLHNEDISVLLENDSVCGKLSELWLEASEFKSRIKKAVFFDNFPRSSFEFELKDLLSFNFKRLSPYSGDIKALKEDIGNIPESGTAVILAGEKKAASVLSEELERNGIKNLFCEKMPEETKKGVYVTLGGLSGGFEIPDLKFILLTHKYVAAEKKKIRRPKNAKEIGSLDELHKGDLVVHSAHGIGIFDGIEHISNSGTIKDYIKIKYRGTDVLYVPVTQLDLVSKYIGSAEDGTVKLNKLGSDEWKKTRSRVRSAVRDMAKQLTKLYAKRMSQKGYAFSKDTDLQNNFERRFEYEETDDQLRCIEEIKKDMERDIPMDRLLCGDVGFGKTEVALRAAFKCISDGKQCALLVPTTVLAMQHYDTIIRRFGDLPVTVKLISRFTMPAAQRKTLSDLKRGKVDMLVGTHRLISKDVEFRDLGLVIIDEEQRFGVEQKERLKEKYPSVDVLTLSATPIPRTLNMSLSGLRDMSSIDEAPSDRYPVQTYVTEQDDGIITEAIIRELRRAGQVYYLHNRVDTIMRCAAKLKEKLPEARIAVAHGRMSEDELTGVWQKLIEHEIDVLVCTTIIETGVDVPNVNTLIIENADKMGLSQLHQLRGRVGRSPRRAYAYFCFPKGRELSDIAAKRLEAIRQFTQFGSGFKIALRDLEIRGAGSILGGEQHGHIESVGYDMYLKMLADAVNEENGAEAREESIICTVDLNISAHIPDSYIPSLNARLDIYKKIADIKTDGDRSELIDELCDRFGDPPKSVMGLIEISTLRNAASELGITEITESGITVILHTEHINEKASALLSEEFGPRFFVSVKDSKPCYMIRKQPKEKTKDIVSALSAVFTKNL